MEELISLHGLVVMLGLLVYVVVSHLTETRRHPTSAIAWVLFIILVPYAAVPIFLAFGSRKQARPRSAPDHHVAPLGVGGSWVLQTLHALGQPAPASYRGLNVHADGRQALQALWQHLESAQESIDAAQRLASILFSERGRSARGTIMDQAAIREELRDASTISR